ncbi:hypothetical protein O181_010620 [Austropuccinia psidii MF-1]|uniref:Uncharacterized protein n=1 Tax=Austropuccinia psidii MF-1 TaxID=1389203 RepID=A0A9Q3GL33_9BASI|nr:hypothetical protein [Austropuccinia psidii MF-1]
MSHLRQDNVNHHMCHMRMSLKAQNHFHTICNVWVITPHGATQQSGMLILFHAYAPAPAPDETPTLPPHLRPNNSLGFCTPASSSPWITIFTLLRGPQVMPPTPPSPPLPSLCSWSECLPNMPPMPPTILTLAVPSQHASDTAYYPYAHSALPTRL